MVNLTSEIDPEQSLEMLRQYSVDGVIVMTSELPSVFSEAFHEAGLPVVHAFGRLTGTQDVHTVSIDDRNCGRMAADLLIRKGYRSIAFMGGPGETTVTQYRCAGFEEEAAKHPGVRASHSFAGTHSFQAGRAEMLRLLEGEAAEAYFCGDDVLSIGAISAIESKGLRVPEDIGIIGLDDMEIAGWENISLTTIQQPIGRIVEATIDLIAAMMEDPNREPESRLFPCRIVERGTLRQG